MKKKPNFSNLLVIAHGKSEYDIFMFVLSSLGKPLYVYANKKGKQYDSIQITSLSQTLKKSPFNNQKNFNNKYPSIEKDKKTYVNFKIAIVMDTDDCTQREKENFLSKNMFEGHWLYDYIYPIHNTENLEDVLNRCKIPYPESKKENYQKVFPAGRGILPKTSIKNVSDLLAKYPHSTNMHEVLEYALKGLD